jgi:hypothetical protein
MHAPELQASRLACALFLAFILAYVFVHHDLVLGLSK